MAPSCRNLCKNIGLIEGPYTNTVSDTRRAKAAAGRVTQWSNPLVAIATAASATVIDTAVGANPSRTAWMPHKSGRWTK